MYGHLQNVISGRLFVALLRIYIAVGPTVDRSSVSIRFGQIFYSTCLSQTWNPQDIRWFLWLQMVTQPRSVEVFTFTNLLELFNLPLANVILRIHCGESSLVWSTVFAVIAFLGFCNISRAGFAFGDETWIPPGTLFGNLH